MIRKLMLVLAALAVIGFAAAQIILDPVEGNDDVAKGKDEAHVEQTVVLDVPKLTALHLTADTITFDLSALNGGDWRTRALEGGTPDGVAFACVYTDNEDAEPGGGFYGQQQFVPGRIFYKALAWDKIELRHYDGSPQGEAIPESDRVVTYPPIRFVDGEAVKRGDMVCYQTFVIQLFSSWGFFDLQVSRNDNDKDASIAHLYVQGNTCADFGEGTGLYDLPDEDMRRLIPQTTVARPDGTNAPMNSGPTGAWSSDDCNPGSGWLDVLGVLAVKLDSTTVGQTVANLTYTLLSADTQFPAN